MPLRVKLFSNSAVVSDVSINYKVDVGHAKVDLIGEIYLLFAVVDCNQKPSPKDPVQEKPLVADTVTGVVLVDVAIIISVCVADTNLIVTLTIHMVIKF